MAKNEEIGEYFARNGIVKRMLHEASEKHKGIAFLEKDEDYYKEHFKTGLDDFLDGVNIESNTALFDVLLQEARKSDDVFEPCCQSGLLGCYIAGNIAGKYKGMDISAEGIEKARRRAVANGLDAGLFLHGNVMDYEGRHELVIGRNVLNDGEHSINEEMLKKIAGISKRFVLIEGLSASIPVEIAPSVYEVAMKKQGLSFSMIYPPIRTATNGNMFVVEGKVSED